MLVLFDQGTPVPIANSLLGHSVKTARQLGWDTLANGELLRAAEEAGFDVLLTTDKNLAEPEGPQARHSGAGQKQVEPHQSRAPTNRGCSEWGRSGKLRHC